VTLTLDLDPERTRVHARMHFEAASPIKQALVLNGQDLELESVALDGQALLPHEFTLHDETLTVYPDTDQFTLDIFSACRPAGNSSLMGLYVSGDHLFTQCEAEGFRRITWFPDRPDVMSQYQVILRADRKKYP